MLFPVDKTQFHVGSKFGWRTHPVHGDRRFHNGVDIGCPIGTQVQAVLPGVVIRVWYDIYNDELKKGGGGLAMRVLSDNNVMLSYCHLSEIFYGPNDKVAAGDTIALSGNTGISTCPHLHLTYRKNGEPQDPEPLFD